MLCGRSIIKFCRRVRNRLSSYCNLIRLHIYHVDYGAHCCIHGKIYINLFQSARMKIGDHFYCSSGVCVNALSTNKRGAFYATDEAVIEIGIYVGMSSPVLWCHKRITIGNHVKLGAGCVLIDTDAHNMDYLSRREQCTDWGATAPIVIEDDAFIGMNCIILKGVTIGSRSIIAAGSVVTRSIPADCIAGGNPARVIRNLNTDDKE